MHDSDCYCECSDKQVHMQRPPLAPLMGVVFLGNHLPILFKLFNILGIMGALGRGAHVGTIIAQEVHSAVFRNDAVFADDRLDDRRCLLWFHPSVDLVWLLPVVAADHARVGGHDDGDLDLHRNTTQGDQQYRP